MTSNGCLFIEEIGMELMQIRAQQPQDSCQWILIRHAHGPTEGIWGPYACAVILMALLHIGSTCVQSNNISSWKSVVLINTFSVKMYSFVRAVFFFLYKLYSKYDLPVKVTY